MEKIRKKYALKFHRNKILGPENGHLKKVVCLSLPEDDVVGEGDDVGHEPEEGGVLPVVEVDGGHVLGGALLAIEVALHVLVEPGLVPTAHVVNL